MDDLNEWLNSFNSSNASTGLPTVPTNPPSDAATAPQQEEPQPQALSNQDFDDILHDFGFTPPVEITAEEVSDENNQAAVAGIEEHDWQTSFDSSTQDNEEDSEMEGAESEAQQADVAPQVSSGIVVENPETIFIASASEPSDEPEQQRELLIPTNSPTLLMDESTTRFSGAEWYNEIQKQNVIIAGLGGIGSWLAIQLARMHPQRIVMYDADTVEAVNMAGQMYSKADIGKTKVGAMCDTISDYTIMQNIYAIPEMFTSSTEAGNIMLSGFDNMQARKTFFEAWYNHVMQLPQAERKKCLYLDGRLSISVLQVLCLTGDDEVNIARYNNEFLFTDAEAEHTVCSLKQTSYLACMIGSVMVNLFTNWVANSLDPVIPYDLPFFTEYDAQNMIFKTVK